MKTSIVNYFNSADYESVIKKVLDTASKLMSLDNKEINITPIANNKKTVALGEIEIFFNFPGFAF